MPKEKEYCEVCDCKIDHSTTKYYNLCADCAPEPDCCPTCGYEYTADDDGGVCWDCDMEMFAIFSGLI